MPVAVFRVDGSPDIGGGHVMRCLTLANALSEQGWQCHFACIPESLQVIPALAESPHQIIILGKEQISDPAVIFKALPDGIDLLIVDHYALDVGYESLCRPWAKKILIIDDLANRPHDADILLDQTLGRQAQDYKSLVNNSCHLLLGTQYALLRPEFAQAREDLLLYRAGRQNFSRLLISLGATDPDNITGKVLEAVGGSTLPLHIDIILGASAPFRKTVMQQIKSLSLSCKLHIDPDIATLIELMHADLAIGAAGTSVWERCCLGLPTLLLILAENQQQNADVLNKTGAAKIISSQNGIIKDNIQKSLKLLQTDSGAMVTMGSKAAQLCDGLGTNLVVGLISINT